MKISISSKNNKFHLNKITLTHKSPEKETMLSKRFSIVGNFKQIFINSFKKIQKD